VSLLESAEALVSGAGVTAAFVGGASTTIAAKQTAELDDQRERRLLAGGRLQRRADAEVLRRVVDPDTSFRTATRTSPE
jgi:hypothetical protein